jgi:hypothetical protein
MQNETIIAVIISTLISPMVLKLLEFVFGILSSSKQKERLAIEKMGSHITMLEKQITEMKDSHALQMSGMRESLAKEYNLKYETLHKEIGELRVENVNLRILIAENGVKLDMKEETIARLTDLVKEGKLAR